MSRVCEYLHFWYLNFLMMDFSKPSARYLRHLGWLRLVLPEGSAREVGTCTVELWPLGLRKNGKTHRAMQKGAIPIGFQTPWGWRYDWTPKTYLKHQT